MVVVGKLHSFFSYRQKTKTCFQMIAFKFSQVKKLQLPTTFFFFLVFWLETLLIMAAEFYLVLV